MHKALLDIDPLTGVRQYFGWDNDGNEYLVDEIDQAHTKAIIDQNKRLANADAGRGKDMRLVASVPPQVQFEWLDKHGVEFWNPAHKDGVKRLLNDPDYRYLRIQNIIL